MNTNIYVDYNDMEFETTRENNQSITASSDQVLLGSKSLKLKKTKLIGHIINSLHLENSIFVFKFIGKVSV